MVLSSSSEAALHMPPNASLSKTLFSNLPKWHTGSRRIYGNKIYIYIMMMHMQTFHFTPAAIKTNSIWKKNIDSYKKQNKKMWINSYCMTSEHSSKRTWNKCRISITYTSLAETMIYYGTVTISGLYNKHSAVRKSWTNMALEERT